jgi:hypothetical protein
LMSPNLLSQQFHTHGRTTIHLLFLSYSKVAKRCLSG